MKGLAFALGGSGGCKAPGTWGPSGDRGRFWVEGPQEAALRFLLANPRMVLDMESAGLPSAIDGDLTSQLRNDLDSKP